MNHSPLLNHFVQNFRRNRLTALMCLLCAALLITFTLAYAQFDASRDAATGAARDATSARRLSAAIVRLKGAPLLAGSAALASSELTHKVEQAAAAVGIQPDALVRVAPESPRRMSTSPYREHPVDLLLRQVTLTQLVSFLHGLTGGDGGLEVTAMRLSAPRERETADRWTAELTLSYLTFAPVKENNP